MLNDYESRKSKGRKRQERKHSFADALKTLPNDQFITPEFQKNHIHRGSPSPEQAEKMAEKRGKANTTLFLEGKDYERLANDVRQYNKKIDKVRKKAYKESQKYNTKYENPTFVSSQQFSYISAFPTEDGYQAGVSRFGRISFSARKMGEIEWQGAVRPIYAVSHLDKMLDTKHPFEDWEMHEVHDEDEVLEAELAYEDFSESDEEWETEREYEGDEDSV